MLLGSVARSHRHLCFKKMNKKFDITTGTKKIKHVRMKYRSLTGPVTASSSRYVTFHLL